MLEKLVMRGFIANVDVVPALIVTFRFNPESIRDNRSVYYADRMAGLCEDTPGKVYTGGDGRTISFKINLHGLEQGLNTSNPTPVDNGVSTELAKLRSFMYPKTDAWTTIDFGNKGRRINSPPTCIFGFGTKILECIVTGLDITETQFNSALAPVRADVSITLSVIEDRDDKLHIVDTQRRNALAYLGTQNMRAF